MGELFSKERRAQEAFRATTAAVCSVYGTPRQHYRPILGVSGTLQATPNPCMEKDRRRPNEAGVDYQLGRFDLDPCRPRRPDRRAEADLSFGVPPHQVHHHHFGWTSAGPKPEAAVFSARRPWGIGLQYSEDILPVFRRIKQCPDTAKTPRPRHRSQRVDRVVSVSDAISPGGAAWRRRGQEFPDQASAMSPSAAPVQHGSQQGF